MSNAQPRRSFSSPLAFALVSMGAAVGLANVWSFPFVAGENGGGAFLLLYLLVLFVVATPIFMGEIILGKLGKASPIKSLRSLRASSGSRLPWVWMAYLGVASTILVLSFYVVIAGQALAYGFEAIQGTFSGMSELEVSAFGGEFVSSIPKLIVWMLIFMTATGLIVARNINDGIEKAGVFLMPTLVIMLLGMIIYGAIYGDFSQAVDFLFGVRFEDFTPKVILEAMGQAFFTIGIGVGGMMMLGTYMGDDVNLPKMTAVIVIADLVIALMAGLMIFPLVFAGDVSPAAGPNLIFQVLPLVFGDIPGGSVVGALFFILLTFAALTSAILLMAPSVQWMQDIGYSRRRGALMMSALVAVLSLMTIFSYNIASDFYPLGFIPMFNEMTMFDLIRKGINNIVLPIGGFAFSWMVAWGLNRDEVIGALNGGSPAFQAAWYYSLKYIAPVSITAILLYTVIGF